MILEYLLLHIAQILLIAHPHFLLNPLRKLLTLNNGSLGLPLQLTLHLPVDLLLELLDILGLQEAEQIAVLRVAGFWLGKNAGA